MNMKVARRSIVTRKGEGMRDPRPPLPHPQKINVEFTGASVCDFIAFLLVWVQTSVFFGHAVLIVKNEKKINVRLICKKIFIS